MFGDRQGASESLRVQEHIILQALINQDSTTGVRFITVLCPLFFSLICDLIFRRASLGGTFRPTMVWPIHEKVLSFYRYSRAQIQIRNFAQLQMPPYQVWNRPRYPLVMRMSSLRCGHRKRGN